MPSEIVVEMKLAVVVAPSRLILTIALEEDARLKAVAPPYLAQVISDVDSGIGVLVGHCPKVSPGPRLSQHPNAVHLEIGDGNAVIDRKWQWDLRYFGVIGAADIAVLALSTQLRHARADGELADQCR